MSTVSDTKRDETLFDSWCAGDRAAGCVLIELHFPPVYRFFANKVAADIEDLAQQTFLRCIEYKDRFRREASFRTFLFSIAHSTLYDYLRARSRRPNADFGVSSVGDMGVTASSLVANAEEVRLVAQAFRQVPVALQVVLELHYWEELSTAEIACILDVPQGTIKSRLRRARAAVARHIADANGLQRSAFPLSRLDDWANRAGAELRGELVEREPGR